MLRSFVGFFAARPPLTLLLWVAAVGFGVIAYTALLPREGFPSIDVPIAVASGTYLVEDPLEVDRDVAAPLSDAILGQPEVEGVQSFARRSSFVIVATFESGVTSAEGTEIINDALIGLDLPDEAIVSVDQVNASKFLDEFDLLVGVYGNLDTTADELSEAATRLLPAFDAEPDIERFEVVELIARGTNPATGETVTRESDFNLFTATTESRLEFRPSIAIGVVAADGVDSLAIRDATDRALARGADDLLQPGFEAVVAIDFATQIRNQIGSLQANVLTGVIAVAIVALVALVGLVGLDRNGPVHSHGAGHNCRRALSGGDQPEHDLVVRRDPGPRPLR